MYFQTVLAVKDTNVHKFVAIIQKLKTSYKKKKALIFSAQLQIFQHWSNLNTLNDDAFHIPKAQLLLTAAGY